MNKETKLKIEKLKAKISASPIPKVEDYMALSTLYLFEKNEKERKECLRNALDLQTKILQQENIDFVKESMQLQFIYKMLDQDFLAKRTIEKVIEYLKTQPESADNFVKFGQAYYDNNDIAEQYFKKALAIEPNNLEALRGLFNIYVDHHGGSADKRKAEEIAYIIKKLDPKNPHIEFMDMMLADFDKNQKFISECADILGIETTRTVIDSTKGTNLLTGDIEFLKKRDWVSYIILLIAVGVVIYIWYFS